MESMDILQYADSVGYGLYPVQRVILKLIYGLPLDRDSLFEVAYGPTRSVRRFTEADYVDALFLDNRCSTASRDERPSWDRDRNVCISMGRRSGKNRLCDLIAAFETRSVLALPDPHREFGVPPLTLLQILYLGSIEDQRGLDGLVSTTLQDYLRGIANSTFRFRTDARNQSLVTLMCRNFVTSSIRGGSYPSVLFNDLREGAFRIGYDTVVAPRTTRFLAIQTPYENGSFNSLFNSIMSWDTRGLAISIPTWEAVPNYPESVYGTQLSLGDPATFAREFGGFVSRGITPEENMWFQLEEAISSQPVVVPPPEDVPWSWVEWDS